MAVARAGVGVGVGGGVGGGVSAGAGAGTGARVEWLGRAAGEVWGAMWSVGHLPLIAELRKIASPSDLSSSVLWCCASDGWGSPPLRREEMWSLRTVMS